MSSSNNNDNKPSGHDSVVDDFGEDSGATRGDLPTRSKDLEFEYQLLHVTVTVDSALSMSIREN